jgi:hypothetical protein
MPKYPRILMAVALVVLPARSASAQAPSSTQIDRPLPQTSTISVERGTAGTDPLDNTRVSVQFVNSQAAAVMQVLTKAAGLTMEMPPARLLPVTITLTNVRLRVALDAICDTAACTWRLNGSTVTLSPAVVAAGELPPALSLSLDKVPVPDVFRAIGTALGVVLVIEGRSEGPPASVNFTNTDTRMALDFLCKLGRCAWEFDRNARELRVRFMAP